MKNAKDMVWLAIWLIAIGVLVKISLHHRTPEFWLGVECTAAFAVAAWRANIHIDRLRKKPKRTRKSQPPEKDPDPGEKLRLVP